MDLNSPQRSLSSADILAFPLVHAPLSAMKIPKAVDDEMDKTNPSNGHVKPGISIRNGPMENHDHHTPDVNGVNGVNGVNTNGSTSKRKSRGSLVKPTYAEADSSDDDDQPLVRLSSLRHAGYTALRHGLLIKSFTDPYPDQASTDIPAEIWNRCRIGLG